jgi:alpha,alpha-trehalase
VSGPRYLPGAWSVLAPRLARPSQVALFADFDGTLAPIRRRPGDVRLVPRVRGLLAELAGCGALVGVISGRRLSDVRSRVGLRGIWYAGGHGHFLASPHKGRFTLVGPAERARMTRIRRRIARALQAEPKIWIEPKDASVAVHYRGAAASSCRRARELVHAVLAEQPGLRLLHGKKIWEILPAGDVDKWAAVRFILKRGAPRRTVVYLGDDVTDERVFECMRGISVYVGGKRATAAKFWLRSPAEVRQFLERCLRLWQGRLPRATHTHR